TFLSLGRFLPTSLRSMDRKSPARTVRETNTTAQRPLNEAFTEKAGRDGSTNRAVRLRKRDGNKPIVNRARRCVMRLNGLALGRHEVRTLEGARRTSHHGNQKL